jgi:hypothetical protein
MKKMIDKLCVVGLFIITGIIGLCFWYAIIIPAISNSSVNSKRNVTMIETESLLKYFYDYAKESKEKVFPESLSKLNGEELKKRGISDVAKLQEKYWYLYLPGPVNGLRDEDMPILIEKTNHYSRSQTGVVAWISKDGIGHWVFYRVGKEYMDLISKYCNNPAWTNTINKQDGKGGGTNGTGDVMGQTDIRKEGGRNRGRSS